MMNNDAEVDRETNETLEQVPELGFVTIREGTIVETIEPILNVYSNVENFRDVWRWNDTIDYLKRYASWHPEFGGSFFLCVYDGWREFSPYVSHERRTYVPWKLMDEVTRLKYLHGRGNADEPRFVHDNEDIGIYPDLCHRVLSYNRHYRDDKSTLLIPDAHFITDQHDPFVLQTRRDDCGWEDKDGSVVLWRGSRNVALNPPESMRYCSYNSHGYYGCHVRDVIVDICRRAIVPGLDASFQSTSVADQLRYKYLLTCDGLVSAWSSTAWKMSSNSLTLQLKSCWEHWYSDLIVPDEHYICLDTIFDVPCTLQWLKHHDSEVLRMIAASKRLMSRIITRDFAVKEYRIH